MSIDRCTVSDPAEGAPSLLWIRAEIERFAMTECPVRAVLQVVVVVVDLGSVATGTNNTIYGQPDQDVRRNVNDRLRQELRQLPIGSLKFDPVPHGNMDREYYISRSGHTDIVKARTVKAFFDVFNAQIAQIHIGNRVFSAKVVYLLSAPLDYLSIEYRDDK